MPSLPPPESRSWVDRCAERSGVNRAIPIYFWSVTNGMRASCCARKRLKSIIFIMTKQGDVTVTKIGSSISGLPDWESRFCFALTHFINIAFAMILCLAKARKSYLEIINYIREKHKNLYAPEQLITFKRNHAPALIVCCSPAERVELEAELEAQTFKDWDLVR